MVVMPVVLHVCSILSMLGGAVLSVNCNLLEFCVSGDILHFKTIMNMV